MAHLVTEEFPYGEKDEKQLHDSNEKISYTDEVRVVDNAHALKELEEFEDRLLRDDASDQEYLVQSGSDVALKVIPTQFSKH